LTEPCALPLIVTTLSTMQIRASGTPTLLAQLAVIGRLILEAVKA
jgi:hypothetical protein